MRISLDDDEDEIHELFSREVNAVLKLDCINDDGKSIVNFQDWFRGRNFACIVMPYIRGGTLAEEIESRTEPYAERRILYYALQLSDALAYAHSRGVVHHDIKPSNVLVNRNVGRTTCTFGLWECCFSGGRSRTSIHQVVCCTRATICI
jgi:serine/threonine protein kinase